MPDLDLSGLSPQTFEHLVNAIAMRVLGAGATGFGPGSDGGRDGLFEGRAPYPSNTEQWNGTWFIQSKFHPPHLSKDHNQWLVEQVKSELDAFNNPDSGRTPPTIWILATNIDPSGTPETGSHDKIRNLVEQRLPSVGKRMSIWGGEKIKAWLAQYRDIAERYTHLLTPGHVLANLMAQLGDERASVEQVINCLTTMDFHEHAHAKIDQGGFEGDRRPGIHSLFVDLPFACNHASIKSSITQHLAATTNQSHRPAVPLLDRQLDHAHWDAWERHPSRAPVWLIKGGPGNGKSTIGQFFCHIQRAAFILANQSATELEMERLANEVQRVATPLGLWPKIPRLPIQIDLKDYAKWLSSEPPPNGILSYLAWRIAGRIEQPVLANTVRRALQNRPCCAVFDGLDEVPDSLKESVAKNVIQFIRDHSPVCDLLSICTSRPQGYSGQFDSIPGLANIELLRLPKETALECGLKLLNATLPHQQAAERGTALRESLEAPTVQELTTTPLQAHILAIISRSGGHPPERKHELFSRFYEVMQAREANRNLPDLALARILKEETELLKEVHARLGFELHARAERAIGAQASLSQREFEALARHVVEERCDNNTEETVQALLRAATTRLVLISTPTDGDQVHFEIRQLQEYFAAEYLYENVEINTIIRRFDAIAGDQHWREVVLFMLGGFVARGRRSELIAAVESLRSLDRIEADRPETYVSSELGRGALLTASLLRDGSLEHDRRSRLLFSDLVLNFSKLGAGPILESVAGIRATASKLFVRKQLESTLTDDGTVAFGTLLILALTTEDGDEGVPRLVRLMERAPSHHQRRLNQVLASRPSPERAWFAEWLTKQATTTNRTGVLEGLRRLRAHSMGRKQVDRALDGLGLTRAGDLLQVTYFRDAGTKPRDFEWIEVSDLSSGVAAAEALEGLELPPSSTLSLLQQLGSFVANPTRTGLLTFLTNARGADAVWDMPFELAEPIAFELRDLGYPGLLNLISEMNEAAFPAWWQRVRNNWSVGGFKMKSNPDLEDSKIELGFENAVRVSALAWHIAVDGEENQSPARDQRIIALMISAAIRVREVRRQLPLEHWHLLLDAPGGEKLRAALRLDGETNRRPGGFVAFNERVTWSPESLANIRLQLPDDAGLLSWIFSLIGVRLTSAKRAQRPTRQKLAATLVEMGASSRALKLVIESDWPTHVRQTAAALLLIVDSEDSSSQLLARTAFEKAAQDSGAVAALMTALELAELRSEARLIETLGLLLRDLGENEREGFGHLVLAWRERSTTPVSSQGLQSFLDH